MLRAVCFAAALLFVSTAHAQVYKCTGPGGVTYSQTPCASGGQLLDASKPSSFAEQAKQPKTQAREVERAFSQQQAPAQPEPPAPAPRSPATAATVCPSDQEIRDMETSASSIKLGDKERRFLQAELRRAHACRKEGGNYTTEDWARIKDAQSGQNRIGQRDRERERAAAEAIHAPSASDRENQRMIADKLAEEARKANTLNCDATGCWSRNGIRYNRFPNSNNFTRRTDGAFCQLIGTQMQCR